MTILTEFCAEKKDHPYLPITTNDRILLQVGESRKFLAGIGLQGEIIHTPGHSNDSITLILDEGFAFSGDLHPVFMLPEDDPGSKASWDTIHKYKIKTIFTGHGK